MPYSLITKETTNTITLFSNKGSIITSHQNLCSIDKNEKLNCAIIIKEYPELIVSFDGEIIFDKTKKYKETENIHIDGTISVLEPKYEYCYVKTTPENIFVDKPHKYRINQTTSSKDIIKKCIDNGAYYTQAQYDAMETYQKCRLKKEIKMVETIIDLDKINDNIDDIINSPDISIKYIKNGYKVKDTYEFVNEIVQYKRKRMFCDIDVIDKFIFVKSITIKSESKGQCRLMLNDYDVATIPFNQKFDFTTEPGNDSVYYSCIHYGSIYDEKNIYDDKIGELHNAYLLTRNEHIDALYIGKFKRVILRFHEPIDDFDIIVEEVNMINERGEYCISNGCSAFIDREEYCISN